MAEDVKHTPGPWKIDHPFYGEIVSGGGLKIASWWSDEDYRAATEVVVERPCVPDDQGRANARLIAAAPDLYEVAKLAEQFITNGVELGYIRLPDEGSNDPALKTLPAIKAALSRAKGESQ